MSKLYCIDLTESKTYATKMREVIDQRLELQSRIMFFLVGFHHHILPDTCLTLCTAAAQLTARLQKILEPGVPAGTGAAGQAKQMLLEDMQPDDVCQLLAKLYIPQVGW